MRNKSKPQGRRGLRPWGLSHSYRFRKEGINNEKRALFVIESVYSFRVKLPKYVWAIYYGGLIIEKDIQEAGISWAKQLNTAIGLNTEAKILDFNFRSKDPELTIDFIVKDSEKDMKSFVEHMLPVIKSLVTLLLEKFRQVLLQYFVSKSEYMGYFIVKLDGTPTKNGAIRWRRPRLRG